MKELTLDFHSQLERRKIFVDEQVWKAYLEEYVRAYVKQRDWYDIGKMSGRVLYNGRMYGEIAKFTENLPLAKRLEVSIAALNPHLMSPEIRKIYAKMLNFKGNIMTYGAWLSIDDEAFNETKEQIEAMIVNEQGNAFGKDGEYTFHTYEQEGKEVVYFSFYQACDGYGDIYKVPLDVAYELYLGDYQGREMSRFDDLWNQLDSYEVSVDVEYDEQGWIEKSPFNMIEAFNFD